MKFPGKRGGRARAWPSRCRALDVVPTVLEAPGLPLPADLGGQPLQRTLAGAAKPRPALAEISHRGFVAHGVRTDADKYVRRFSPEDDELYFDLARDPREKTSLAGASPERVRLLQAQAEAGMAPNPFRYVRPGRGPGRFALKLETRRLARGRRGDRASARRSAGRLGGQRAAARARASQPRARRAAGDRLHRAPGGGAGDARGTRDGRPLRPADVAVGEGCAPPRRVPLPAARHRVGDRARTAASTSSPPPRGTRAGRAGLARPAAGPLAPGAGPGDARAAEGARLRGAGIARMARLLVFDLDGTLVDSSRDIAAAVNAALRRLAPGTAAIPLDAILSFVGEGARLLVERSLRHAGLALPADEVLPVYLECYGERLLDTTRLYPGVAEALDALAGRDASPCSPTSPATSAARSSRASASPRASRGSGARATCRRASPTPRASSA